MSAIVPTLDEILTQQVRQHTGRRVQDLAVEVVGEQVIVRGRALSFYVKQLATHGVRSVLPQAPLQNAIVVE